MKRKIAIAAVATSLVLGGGAAVAFADDDGRDDTKNTARDVTTDVRAAAPAADGSAQVTAAAGAKLTAAEAIAKALEAQPGTAVSADLDTDADRDDDGDDRHRGWEVDILGKGSTSYQVVLDPSSGRVLDTRTDRSDDDARQDRALLKGADVTAAEAAKAGAAKGVVTSVDLDDDGKGAWDVETDGDTAKERDWNVDLASGAVTADRTDDNARATGAKTTDDDRDDDADDRDDRDGDDD
ncbi:MULTISPECIES: PepSY domain-containing protein [unclassified Streptomyces]|uniref:PepSY domain-containing protein n=1 Tax=unclassified Streptomyces TaxID=2593676 RepID=UPI0037F803B0